MKEIIRYTNLAESGLKFTSNSVRKTAVRTLKKAKIPESTIIRLTEHSSKKGLRSCDPGDDGEFTEMSFAITGSGEPQPTQPTSKSNQSVLCHNSPLSRVSATLLCNRICQQWDHPQHNLKRRRKIFSTISAKCTTFKIWGPRSAREGIISMTQVMTIFSEMTVLHHIQ